jgi:hypothetical protein
LLPEGLLASEVLMALVVLVELSQHLLETWSMLVATELPRPL